MAVIKYASREIVCKIVYYGPGRAGKTTNVKYIFTQIPDQRKSDIVSMATKQDRTLFFDFMPVELGSFKGFNTRLQIYTVPGQVIYDSTRKLVLKGADGVVFVADSLRSRAEDNLWSWENMIENMENNNLKLEEVPIIMEYNKRDLDDILSIEELERDLNPDHYPSFPSTATTGEGIIEVFKTIGTEVLKQVKNKLGN